MLITTILAATVATTPFIGIVDSYLYSPGEPILVSGAFIGPFEHEADCQMAVIAAGKAFDLSANRSIKRADLRVLSHVQCSQAEAVQRAFRVVALEPGKYFFDAPYIALNTRGGIRTGLIFVLPIEEAACHHTAAETKAANPDVTEAACIWPKQSLPVLSQ